MTDDYERKKRLNSDLLPYGVLANPIKLITKLELCLSNTSYLSRNLLEIFFIYSKAIYTQMLDYRVLRSSENMKTLSSQQHLMRKLVNSNQLLLTN